MPTGKRPRHPSNNFAPLSRSARHSFSQATHVRRYSVSFRYSVVVFVCVCTYVTIVNQSISLTLVNLHARASLARVGQRGNEEAFGVLLANNQTMSRTLYAENLKPMQRSVHPVITSAITQCVLIQQAHQLNEQRK